MTGWAEIKTETGEGDKVIMSTSRISAFYSGNAFPEITAFQEFFYNLRDPVDAVIAIDFGVILIIDFLEPCKMVFEQGLQNILSPWYIFMT